MRAAVFHAPNDVLTVEDIDLAEPRSEEVVVRTGASGVCHSDLHFVEGLYSMATPAVLGHEGAGVVEAVGDDVTMFAPGDRVIACLSIFCGYCDRCLSGEPFLCLERPMRGRGDEPALSWKGGGLTQMAGLATYAEKMLVHQNALVEDRAGHRGRPHGPDWLWCDHRPRRGPQHRGHRGRFHGRGLRRGRRRAVRHPGRAHRWRAHDHRRRRARVEAGDRPRTGRHALSRRLLARPGGGDQGHRRRRRRLHLRSDRPQGHRRAGLRGDPPRRHSDGDRDDPAGREG